MEERRRSGGLKAMKSEVRDASAEVRPIEREGSDLRGSTGGVFHGSNDFGADHIPKPRSPHNEDAGDEE
jgi:hypothetical protein